MPISKNSDFSLLGNIILGVLICGVLFLFLVYLRRLALVIFDSMELLYARFKKRPFYLYLYLFKKDLTKKQRDILKSDFTFYKKLNAVQQANFRHRVAMFIKLKTFEGKDGFLITDHVKILVGATATMLTFGFRKYKIPYVETILVYPTEYYSNMGKRYHKGEFNAAYKAIVLSWDNFLEGCKIENDKINLGIHEFAHAIHYNSIKSDDVNAIIFVDTFNALRQMLNTDETLKINLKHSELLRNYAFTNDSELLAVIIETFIESPKTFKRMFPVIYKMVRQMLNFNFAGY